MSSLLIAVSLTLLGSVLSVAYAFVSLQTHGTKKGVVQGFQLEVKCDFCAAGHSAPVWSPNGCAQELDIIRIVRDFHEYLQDDNT